MLKPIDDLLREPFDTSRLAEGQTIRVGHELFHTGGCGGCNDRNATDHGLHHHVRKAFVVRGYADKIASGHHGIGIGNMSVEMDHLIQTLLSDELSKLRFVRAFAKQMEFKRLRRIARPR